MSLINNLPPIQSISANLIAAATAPRVNVSVPSSTFGNAVNVDIAGTPPWMQREASQSDLEKFTDIVRRRSILNPNENLTDSTNPDDVAKNLFTLHKAMGRLQDIAQYAETGELRDKNRQTLQRMFDAGVSEFKSLLSSVNLGDISLAFDRNRDSLEADGLFVLPDFSFSAKGVETAPDAAVDGLPSDAAFDITIEKNGSSETISVTLSDLDTEGKPRSLENIAGLINGKLTEAGFGSAMFVQSEKDNENVFTGKRQFSITPGLGEKISFSSASGTEAALWTGGTASGGDFSDGYLTRFNPEADSGIEIHQTIDYSGNGPQSDTVQAMVSSVNGSLYIAGTTRGDVSGVNRSSISEAWLMRQDGAGEVIWERGLDFAVSGIVNSMTSDNDGNIYVAGQATNGISGDSLNNTAFLNKYDPAGELIWSREFSGNSGNAAASVVSVKPNGQIMLAGDAMGGLAGSGGTDQDSWSVIMDAATGNTVSSDSIPRVGNDSIIANQFDKNDRQVTASMENGQAYIRQFNLDGSLRWETNLGAVSLTDMTITDNGVAVSSNAGSGSDIAFLSLDGSIDWSRHFNNASLAAIESRDNRIFISGTSTASADGDTSAPINGFAQFSAEFDETGNMAWIDQKETGRPERSSAIAITQTSWIEKIGLSEGMVIESRTFGDSDLVSSFTDSITARTSAKTGDSFSIKVDGKTHDYFVDEQTSIDDLMTAIRKDFGGSLKTDENKFGSAGFTINLTPGTKAEFIPGPDGNDLLSALGINPQIIQIGEIDTKTGEVKSIDGLFDLGLSSEMTLDSDENAAFADGFFIGAKKELQNAYEFLINPVGFKLAQERENNNLSPTGEVPAYLKSQIANFQAGLARLQSSQTNTVGFF